MESVSCNALESLSWRLASVEVHHKSRTDNDGFSWGMIRFAALSDSNKTLEWSWIADGPGASDIQLVRQATGLFSLKGITAVTTPYGDVMDEAAVEELCEMLIQDFRWEHVVRQALDHCNVPATY